MGLGEQGMSKIGERAIIVENGEACPNCLRPYPAPTDGAESVTCGSCHFVMRRCRQCGEVVDGDEPPDGCRDPNCPPGKPVAKLDTFKWKLFTEWYHATLPLGGGDHVDVLYAAWLAGYQTGYDHAY